MKILNRYADDPESLRKASVEYAAEQLIDLADHGVDGLHLYTMNKPEIAQQCVGLLRDSWR